MDCETFASIDRNGIFLYVLKVAQKGQLSAPTSALIVEYVQIRALSLLMCDDAQLA